MTVTAPSPLRVAQARTARLVAETAPRPVYTSEAGREWEPTSGEIARARRALEGIQVILDARPLAHINEWSCCAECDLAPEVLAEYDRLWEIAESVPGNYLL